MLLRNLKLQEKESACDFVERIVNEISKQYGGNLRTYELRSVYRAGTTRAARFMLRCNNSREEPARLSGSGRRTNAANWEAHRQVMQAIFDAQPEAIIVAALATYRGKEDFEKNHGATYAKNAGSKMAPVEFGSL